MCKPLCANYAFSLFEKCIFKGLQTQLAATRKLKSAILNKWFYSIELNRYKNKVLCKQFKIIIFCMDILPDLTILNTLTLIRHFNYAK